MKSIKTIIGALLLTLGAISVASCSQEEDNAVMQEKGNLLKIETSIAETKAIVTGTEFKTGDQISVITLWNVDHFNNLATYDGKWQMEEEVALPESSFAVGAVYPYTAELRREQVTAAGMAWWVYRQDVDLTYKADGQTDYMYGLSTNEVSLSDGTARIQFQHALARVTLALTKSSNDVGEGVVSKVVLRNRSAEDFYAVISNKGVFTVDVIRNRGYINEDKDATATIEVPAECTLSSTVAQNIDMLVIPTSINEDAEFVLTIDGDDYTYIIPKIDWEAGQQYTYPITINRSTIPLPNFNGHEGVDLGFPSDNGEVLYWSTCNLGATSPEEYGSLYGWGDPTGEHLEQCNSDRYDYYLSDETECLALYGGENPLADISGTEYDVVRAMWGTDWRMPTSRELSNLSRYCTVEWTTQNGIQGCVFTSTINGNSIFLPYSPERTGTDISWSEWNTVSGGFHQSSLYWSSSLNEEEPEHASCLYFDNDGNSWIARGGYRYQGLSIRPVIE